MKRTLSLIPFAFLIVASIFLASCSVPTPPVAPNAQAANINILPPVCPVTKPSANVFIPPAPYSPRASFGDFWYGSEKLWTSLRPDGKWFSLPYGSSGYTQKIAWWSNGYDGAKEPEPALKVTGKRLDGSAPPLIASRANNASSPDFGGWAMMVGVDVPTLGCWEITGEYAGAKTTFVVQVTP